MYMLSKTTILLQLSMGLASSLNTWAFAVMKALASAQLTNLMSILAESFYIVIPLLAIYLYLRKDMNAYSLIIAAIVLFIIADIIKMLVMEPRPCTIPGEVTWLNNAVACESSTFSFPSEHAAVLTSLTFFVKNYNYVRIAYVAWLLLILFGRVYLGQHYLTDVIGGVVISLILGYGIFSYRALINRACNNIVGKIIPRAAIKAQSV